VKSGKVSGIYAWEFESGSPKLKVGWSIYLHVHRQLLKGALGGLGLAYDRKDGAA